MVGGSDRLTESDLVEHHAIRPYQLGLDGHGVLLVQPQTVAITLLVTWLQGDQMHLSRIILQPLQTAASDVIKLVGFRADSVECPYEAITAIECLRLGNAPLAIVFNKLRTVADDFIP